MIASPPYAHIPGKTPRHAAGVFDAIRNSVDASMSPALLANSDAFQGGLQFYAQGFYWESHELWEAVWLCCPPNSAERMAVQGLIQLANARLKLAMGKPHAARRLFDLAAAHFTQAGLGARGVVLHCDLGALRQQAEILKVQYCA